MKILGIETSCDETSLAVVENGTNVLQNIISSSSELFTDLGGVIPEEAARKQLEHIPVIIHKILQDFSIDAIAYTKEPGLQGSLLVGRTAAHIMASILKIPLYAVHHTNGHLDSIFLDQTDTITFPVLSVSVSGGHTELWLRTDVCTQELLGKTRDDAAGEAYDKGAQLLGLAYPGGPEIAKIAKTGSANAFAFTLPMQQVDSYDYSFSGLKNALRLHVQALSKTELAVNLKHLAASYQQAINNHLVQKIVKVLTKYSQIQEIHIVGGVAANLDLREKLVQHSQGCIVRWPTKKVYCTDNGAMIAASAYKRFIAK